MRHPITTLRGTLIHARRHSPTPRSLGQTCIKVGLIWFYGMEVRGLLHRRHVWTSRADIFFGLNQTVSSHGTHSVISVVAGNHIRRIAKFSDGSKPFKTRTERNIQCCVVGEFGRKI
jgi:hypothetical protein